MIGKRIRDLRLEHDMSMRDLGEKLGTTATAVCRWENGHNEMTLKRAVQIADLFGITLDELAGREEKYGTR